MGSIDKKTARVTGRLERGGHIRRGREVRWKGVEFRATRVSWQSWQTGRYCLLETAGYMGKAEAEAKNGG